MRLPRRDKREPQDYLQSLNYPRTSHGNLYLRIHQCLPLQLLASPSPQLLGLSLTNRTIRQTLLQHPSAFTHCDLRDEYAASALTRAIERHNTSLPSTHTWTDIYEFHEFFLIASEDSKKFRGRDYISATLRTRLLRECLGAKVWLFGVSGTLWEWDNMSGASLEILQYAALKKGVRLDCAKHGVKPTLLESRNCGICNAVGTFPLVKRTTCELLLRQVHILKIGGDEKRKVAMICPKCEVLDTLVQCTGAGCDNGWIFARDPAESGNPWPVWVTIATVVANLHPTVDLNALYQRWEEVVAQCNVSELAPFAYVPLSPPFDEAQRNVSSQLVFVSSGFSFVLCPSSLVEQWQSMDKVLGEALLWLQRSPVSCAVFEECQECSQNYLCANCLDTECEEVNSRCRTCQRPRVYYRQEEDRSEDGSESDEDTDLEWDSEAVDEDEEAELEEELKWLAVSRKSVDDVMRIDGRLVMVV
ncbi:hypothetical protein K440DRAFT_661026 [Wilcoxina mikolae CBS 423.85]|nr:hypothetical protein K440DRAFT_661026 [Wilcoxina mikolae CBS 423.85]